MSDNDTLSTKQLKTIAALMTCRTVRAASKRAQVSEREVYRWLSEEPAFKAALNQAAQECIDSAVRRLSHLTGDALDVLQSTLKDSRAEDRDRLRAVGLTLTHTFKIKELAELESRIAAIEAALRGKSL